METIAETKQFDGLPPAFEQVESVPLRAEQPLNRREWVRLPDENHISVQNLVKQTVYNPTSLVSIGVSSGVVFVLVSIILAFGQPSIVTNDDGQLQIKKVLFFSLLISGCVFGASWYFLRR